MTDDLFWKIISDACRSDPSSVDEWCDNLISCLTEFPAEEIVQWNMIFDALAQQAYRTDLWAAAYIINGGASDDGFYYFRCWLIGMGREIFAGALQDPDSLANHVSPNWLTEGIDAEAEIYSPAHQAWMEVTGNDYDTPYPCRFEDAELVGDDWDFDDAAEMRKRLPKLSAFSVS